MDCTDGSNVPKEPTQRSLGTPIRPDKRRCSLTGEKPLMVPDSPYGPG